MKDKFLTLINNSKVHRFDLNAAGQKNTRDYAYGKSHYSVGEKFKAEVVFADKTETTVAKIVIKNNCPVHRHRNTPIPRNRGVVWHGI